MADRVGLASVSPPDIGLQQPSLVPSSKYMIINSGAVSEAPSTEIYHGCPFSCSTYRKHFPLNSVQIVQTDVIKYPGLMCNLLL